MSRPRRKQLPLYVECWHDRHGRLRTYFTQGSKWSGDAAAAAQRARVRSRLSCGVDRQRLARGGHTAGRDPGAEHRSVDRALHGEQRLPVAEGDDQERLFFPDGKPAARARSPLGRRDDTRANIKKLLDPDKPGAALARLKAIRVLIRHAIEIGWLDQRSLARHQATEGRRDQVVDRGRDRNVRGSLADW